jgi:hypothetical protein
VSARPYRVRLASTEFRPDPAEVTGVAWAAPGDLGGYPMLPYISGLVGARLEEWLAGSSGLAVRNSIAA